MKTRTLLPWGLAIALAAAAMLLLYARIAMPFSVKPGPIALNYVENAASLSSAGMPNRGQFARIAEAGFGIVVNLAPAGAVGSHDDERELVERGGMRYFQVPVDFAAPQPADYRRFAGILRENRGSRSLVHCQLNMRASSFVFLYRVIELGEDPDRAFEDVARVWTPSTAWRRFLRDTLVASGKSLPLELMQEREGSASL